MFSNEPLTDFSQPDHEQLMQTALEDIGLALGQSYPMILDGKAVKATDSFVSVNPAQKDQSVGIFPKGTPEHINQAINSAWQAFATWSKTSAVERADFLFKAAKLMRERKFWFSAWMVFEVGKTWDEADADTAEAIDFMEFYGQEMLRLSQPQPLTPIATEKNELFYIPLGVGAIIPPWNFPLAICVGMTTAAIVAGNTVVIKPSSDAPTVAYQFVKLLEEVGLPKGVVNLVTGSGAMIGDYLVAHPNIRFISFTGSKDVGLRINELAAKHQPGQRWIKRVVAEMGGKDGILVDRSANLEDAAKGIVAAAFGFAGQKCSACSRAILHQDIYQPLVNRIIELARLLTIGDPTRRQTQVGPVINASAQKKILNYIELGKAEGQLLLGGSKLREHGYYLEPTIFDQIRPEDRLFQEEIFGPVLAITQTPDFQQGLEMMNQTDFGLTGAVYSTDRSHLKQARDHIHVGNLYLNRKCTGALVGVHPFGGFNMSGTDSKAGGHDYLLLFLQAKLVSEKIS